MVARGRKHARRRVDVDAGAQMMNVSPPDLIGKTELVVSGRIQLVERLAPGIVAVVVARCVVVFPEDARRGAGAGEREAGRPMARPRANRIGADRAELRCSFTARVDASERRRDPSCADRRRVRRVAVAVFLELVRRAMSEEVRFDGHARHDAGGDDVDAVEDVPGIRSIELLGHHTQHVAAEAIDRDARPPQRRPHGVERPPGVQPVGVSDQPLLAECELLPSDPGRPPRVGPAAELDVGQPCVDDVAEWRAGRLVRLQKHARVLRLEDDAPDRRCEKRRVQAQTAQHVGIIVPGLEPRAFEALESRSVVGGQVEPLRRRRGKP